MRGSFKRCRPGRGDRRQPTLGVNKPSVWLIEAAFLVLVFDDLRQPLKLACQRCPALRDTHERGARWIEISGAVPRA